MLRPEPEFQHLRNQCAAGLFRRGHRDRLLRSTVRMNRELSFIQSTGQVSSFLAADSVGRFAAHEGIYCRMAGAGPCSLVCHLLGLTEIDPVLYQLPAERFLSARSAEFSLFVDPRHIEQTRKLAAERSSVGNQFCIHPATDCEMLPEAVATLIRETRDQKFHVRDIPHTDSRMGEHLGEYGFEGILPWESEEMQQAANRLKPSSLAALAALLAAYQVGSSRVGLFEEFVQRAAMGSARSAPRSNTSSLLKESYGLLLYQEQVMLILHRSGGIPLMNGYEFIRHSAKGRSSPNCRRRFLAAAAENHLSGREAASVIGEIELAAGHTVCKAHHLATALSTWQSAYLKAHFPREFKTVMEQLPMGSP